MDKEWTRLLLKRRLRAVRSRSSDLFAQVEEKVSGILKLVDVSAEPIVLSVKPSAEEGDEGPDQPPDSDENSFGDEGDPVEEPLSRREAVFVDVSVERVAVIRVGGLHRLRLLFVVLRRRSVGRRLVAGRVMSTGRLVAQTVRVTVVYAVGLVVAAAVTVVVRVIVMTSSSASSTGVRQGWRWYRRQGEGDGDEESQSWVCVFVL